MPAIKQRDYAAICADYRTALQACYGVDVAAKSSVYYEAGWIYINRARIFPDGSCGTTGWATRYRRKQVEEMIGNLLRRAQN